MKQSLTSKHKIMKRNISLIIGILLLCIACQDETFESLQAYLSTNDPVINASNAKYLKIKSFNIKAHVNAIPNNEGPQIDCIPVEADVSLTGSGWVGGQENILGKFDQQNSTYAKEFCEFSITPEGPVVYTRTNVILQNMNGEKLFVLNHMWINVINGEISGYSDIIDGTGRFSGASGRADMLNATVDPETGVASWDEVGNITLVIKD